MKHIHIPDSELTPSAISLGTNRFGSVIPADDAFRLLDEYVELGGNLIDTGHIYADWIPGAPHSASEKTIGAWLRSTGSRDTILLATKGGHPDLATPHISRLSPADLALDVAESLEFLGTDRIDLYWLHRDDPAIPVGDILEPMEEFVRAGQIRYYGCSNWRIGRIRAAAAYAAAHGLRGFLANQPQWSLAIPSREALSDPERLVVFDQESYRFHLETGMAVLPWSSQGQGFFEKVDHLGITGLSEKDRQGYGNAANMARFPPVKEVAERRGVSLTEIALSYLISQPFATIPIVGSRTVEQLRQCMRAADLTLSPSEMAYLQDITMGAMEQG